MADTTGPTVDNLKIAQQLLSAMQQITSHVEKQTEAYQAQAKLVEAICKAQECFGKLDKSKMKEITDGLREAQEQSKEFSTGLEDSNEQAEKLDGVVGKLTKGLKKLIVPVEFVRGFKAGLYLSTELFKTIMRMGGVAFGLLKNIGMSLLSLPGSLLSFFQDAAQSGVDPFRVALEELRDAFGNLSIGTSRAVQDMMPNIKQFEQSGLSLGRVFGYGREGLANVLREYTKLAQDMGPIFNTFARQTARMSGEVMVLTKATSFTGAAMKGLQITANNSGQDITSNLRGIMKDLVRVERTFGFSAKEVGKDLEFMIKESASFGIMVPKDMMKASVYVKKLGLSMETLKKVMDKTLNFEDSAQQVAGLAEAFNLNIDAMKLMKEQDPTKKLDMLREAFFKAGRNVDQLSIAERRRLSDLTGLSDEETRLAFSQKNRALSGAQLDAQMRKAQKTQVSQAEAMRQLSESIKRLVQAGQAMKGGFLETFMKGFEGGIRRSREFRLVVTNLQRAMYQILIAGREVGRMFVKMFPGIQDILRGLSKLFEPSRFKALRVKIVDEFRRLFSVLSTDPKGGFKTFMTNMKKNFFDFFSASSPAGSQFLNGLKTFYKTVGTIFVQGAKYALTSLKDVLKGILGAIRNPAALERGASEFGDGLTGMLVSGFMHLKKELGPVLKDVGSALVDIAKEMFNKFVMPHMHKIIMGAIVFWFGPATVMAVFRAVVAGIFGDMPRLMTSIRGGAAKAGATVGDTASSKGASSPERVADQIKNSAKGMRKLAGSVVMFTAAASAVIGSVILLAALAQSLQVKPESLAMITGVLGAVTIMFVGLVKTGFFQAVERLGDSSKGIGAVAKGLGIGLLAISAIMLAVGGIVFLGAKMFQNVSKEAVNTFMGVMNNMVLLMLGVSASMLVLAGVGLALSSSGGTAAAAIALGMVAVGVVLVGLTKLATVTIADFVTGMNRAGVNAAYAKEVGGILMTFTQLIIQMTLAMSALAFSAPFAAIGTVASKLFGAKSPLESLTEVITGIKVAVLQIVPVVNSISGDVGVLKEKAGVFSTITAGLASLIVPIVDLIKHVTGGLFADVNMTNAMVVEKATKGLTGVISMLADPKTGVVTALLKRVEAMASNMDLAPTQLKASAEVFGILSTGLASMIKAVGEFLGQFEISASFIGGPLSLIASGLGAVAKFKAMEGMITQLIPAISGATKAMLGHVLEFVNGVRNINALKAVGPVLESIGTVLSSTLNSLASVMSNQGVGGAMDSFNQLLSSRSAASLSDERLHQAQTFIQRLSSSLKNLIVGQDGRSGIVGSVATLVAGLPTDPQRIKALSIVTELIKSFASMTAPLISAVSSTLEVTTRNVRTIPGLEAMGRFARSMITSITDSLGDMFSTYLPRFINQVMEIPVVPGLNTKVAALKGVFELVSSITSIVGSLRVDRGGLGAGGMLNTWSQVFLPVMEVMTFFFAKRRIGNVDGHGDMLQGVLDAIGEIRAPGIAQINKVKGVFGAIKSLVDVAKEIRELSGEGDNGLRSLPRMLTAITESLQGTLGANFLNMIQAYQDFSRDLARAGNIPSIDLTLERMGDKLGAKKVARIEQAAANVNVEVNVTLEAGTFNKALYRFAKDKPTREEALRPESFNPSTRNSVGTMRGQ